MIDTKEYDEGTLPIDLASFCYMLACTYSFNCVKEVIDFIWEIDRYAINGGMSLEKEKTTTSASIVFLSKNKINFVFYSFSL